MDAVITPLAEGEPAHFIQITVGHRKPALSVDGLRDAASALRSFRKDAAYEVLYLVPPSSFDSFQAAPVNQPGTDTEVERKVVKFPLVSARDRGPSHCGK